MVLIRLAVFAALACLAASAFARPCGYNPIIIVPSTVDSLSTNNKVTFSANTAPLEVSWGISGEEGRITQETSSYALFTAPRRGELTIVLLVGNGSTCSDIVFRTIQVVHPCVVTPISKVISSSYAGGTAQLEVHSNCNWNVSIPWPQPFWLRIVGPASFSGNGTVTFQFDRISYAGGAGNMVGASYPVYIGDKDVNARVAGWREVGTDFNYDATADLLWRNVKSGVTWMQPLTGLTPGTGSTIDQASAPLHPAPDWRIVDAHTEFDGTYIYWRNFATHDEYEHLFYYGGSYGPTLIAHDDANWRVLGSGIFRGHQDRGILRRNVVTGELRISRPGEDKWIWAESDPNWKVAAVADFDGDGHSDIAWRHAVTGVAFMILDPEVAPVAGVFHREPDLNWQIVAAGDATADGRADLVWRNTADGRIWIQALDGFRTVGSSVVWRDANPDWQINGMADFDGNGSKDLLWRNTATGLVFGVLLDRNLNVIASAVVHNEPNPDWRIVAPNTVDAAASGSH